MMEYNRIDHILLSLLEILLFRSSLFLCVPVQHCVTAILLPPRGRGQGICQVYRTPTDAKFHPLVARRTNDGIPDRKLSADFHVTTDVSLTFKSIPEPVDCFFFFPLEKIEVVDKIDGKGKKKIPPSYNIIS